MNASETPMIFVDTETTDYRPGQIAQLAYLLADGDVVTGAGNYYFAVEYMIPAPNRCTVSPRTCCGDSRRGGPSPSRRTVSAADFEGRMLVAHNVPFDMEFLAAEFARCGHIYAPKSTFCTMRQSTSACRLPRESGGYKWPTLE